MKNLRKALGYTVAMLLVIYTGYLLLLYFAQSTLLYPGTMTHVGGSPPSAPGLEVVKLSAGGAHAEALFLPADTANEPQPVMIFAHGNGEVTDIWVDRFEGFRARNIGVLLIEYPGYGRSPGNPSESTIRKVVIAAYDHLLSDARVDRHRIFAFGQSLGGAAVCMLAQDRPLRALILQSTFANVRAFAASYWAPHFLMKDSYDNLAVVRSFQQPLLVIHGKSDTLIPWREAQRLAAAAPRATFRLYDCGHGCWDPERNSFWQDADALLRAAGILDL
jgi:pimeloyl-ACP methyl ester carboxylesterase